MAVDVEKLLSQAGCRLQQARELLSMKAEDIIREGILVEELPERPTKPAGPADASNERPTEMGRPVGATSDKRDASDPRPLPPVDCPKCGALVTLRPAANRYICRSSTPELRCYVEDAEKFATPARPRG